ncbi:MAG: adenine nucleotide alpha hydrolase [Acidobacteria bacterium]|nr:adenine nucleotide alpha hydrolase [Acidobacteriota bacterium]
MKKALLSWSGGKDSAWALHVLRRSPDITVAGLLTTFNEAFDRVAMHAVRRSLIEAQAAVLDIPLWNVPLPWPCSNQQYEEIFRGVSARAVADGIEAVAFGDLYLTDIRQYRERQLTGSGLEPLFPIWGLPTRELALEMIHSGLRAKLTCIDPRVLSPDFAGREFDAALLSDLPAGVDPCGENGEFHTFVYAGPIFSRAIPVSLGEIVHRDGFVFADLLPSSDRF